MSQKLNLWQPKFTLTEFGIQLLLSECTQNYPQVFSMLLRTLGIDQDVINEYNNKVIQIWLKELVHIIHKQSWSIGHTERNKQKFIVSRTRPESRLGHIWWFDMNLMITWSKINFREQCCSLIKLQVFYFIIIFSPSQNNWVICKRSSKIIDKFHFSLQY